MRCLWIAITITLFATHVAEAAPPPGEQADVFFAGKSVVRLRIEVSEKQLSRLREAPRSYVKATLREGEETVYENIQIKLKGAAGSYRELDDRPALTLRTGELKKSRDFHGLEKFHLNNSVQDETWMHEAICAELFLKAGLPAPRVAHARVWFNGRDLGLYVLKEGFDERFLAKHFRETSGNLYDGGFVQDLDAPLEKDEGDGPDDRSDLTAIVEACRDADFPARAKRLGETVDMEAFLTFMALERATCHWDGYCNNANNYRVYFDPGRQKALFLPHGMDQMFSDTGMGMFDHAWPMLSSAVMQNNDLRRAYREQIRRILPLFSPPDPILAHVDALHERLRPVLHEMDPQLALIHADRVRDLKERITARAANLVEQVDQPEYEVQNFDEKQIARMTDWGGGAENEETRVDEGKVPELGECYRIDGRQGSRCVATWGRNVLLGPGRYRLSATVRLADFHPMVKEGDNDDPGGLTLDVVGFERTEPIRKDTKRQPLKVEFEVREDQRQIDLSIALRARSGRAWIVKDSLELERLGR